MVGIGTYVAFVGDVSAKAGWVQTILIIRIAITLVSGTILLLTNSLPNLATVPWKLILAVAVCDVTAFALFNITIQYLDVSTTMMITSCSSLVTAVIMYGRYKERLQSHQIVGIGITALALTLLSKV
jgi:drug/metabolite transporter (DMT)-like permease